MSEDLDALKQWEGRSETVEDVVSAREARVLAATLDLDRPPAEGDPLPPAWHWMYFIDVKPQSQLGPDGHPKRGGFLPPVPLPRRMWAGGRLEFRAPLRIGERASRTSTIAAVQPKQGRSGTLVFVTVRHEIAGGAGPALVEEQDLVYREAPQPGAPAPQPKPAPEPGGWSRPVEADPVMLFRYSAVTLNGHRIHYDQPYATGVEGYDDLVVHGPLLATLLLDLCRRERPDRPVARFSFRGLAPVTLGPPFRLHGRPDGEAAALWVERGDGALAMTAEAAFG